MAGRNPKPTALKIIEGNRGKGKLNFNEPQPVHLNDLTPPAWLPRAAADIWNEIAPQLRAALVLTELDVQALSMGCVAVAQYRSAVRHVGDELIKSKNIEREDGEGVVEVGEHVNPWLIVQSMTFKQATAIFAQFGMSPVARARIVVNSKGNLPGDEKGGSKNYFS